MEDILMETQPPLEIPKVVRSLWTPCSSLSSRFKHKKQSYSTARIFSSPSKLTTVDKVGNVVVDIESLTTSSSGNPRMKKALSRKGSSRMARRNGEMQDTNDTTKAVIVKVVCSQTEQLKQPNSANAPISDAGDGISRKLNRLMTLNPRRIFLLFASLSSMGTVVLIYFTLAIYRGQSFG